MNATRCPHCQASLPADTGAFCGHCGGRLVQLVPAPAGDSAGGAAVPADAPSPAATQRLEPPVEAPAPRAPVAIQDEAGLPTPPATAMSAAPRATAPIEEEDEFARPPGPRLLNMMAVALVAVMLGAGAGVFVYRRWQAAPAAPSSTRETMARHDPAPPVAPSVTPPVPAEAPPLAAEPSAPGRGGQERKPSRPARAAAGAEPARGSGAAPGRPAPSPSPPPAVAKTAPTPAAPKGGPTAPAGGPAVTAAPASTTPSAPPAASAPTAATPKPTSSARVALPEDNGERAPVDEETLAEERQGEIMAEGIVFVVKTRRAQWSGCYERAFKNETTLPTARVEIEFTIDREGRARRIKTVSNNTDNAQLSSCLEHLLAEWQFPRPPAGEFATSYTFKIAGG